MPFGRPVLARGGELPRATLEYRVLYYEVLEYRVLEYRVLGYSLPWNRLRRAGMQRATRFSPLS
jgi:hypothetical protein